MAIPKLKKSRDTERLTTIEVVATDRNLFRSDAGWSKPAASFTPDAQRRILAKTGADLNIPPNKQADFWRIVERICIGFAYNFQLDLMPQPSAEAVRTARAAAERLKAALPPFLGLNPGNRMASLLYLLDDFVTHLDTHVKPRSAKPKRMAGRIFIPEMMRLFAGSFKQAASEAPDGYFARFVLACLDETDGLPETVSGEWVQSYVRENNKQKKIVQ